MSESFTSTWAPTCDSWKTFVDWFDAIVSCTRCCFRFFYCLINAVTTFRPQLKFKWPDLSLFESIKSVVSRWWYQFCCFFFLQKTCYIWTFFNSFEVAWSLTPCFNLAISFRVMWRSNRWFIHKVINKWNSVSRELERGTVSLYDFGMIRWECIRCWEWIQSLECRNIISHQSSFTFI